MNVDSLRQYAKSAVLMDGASVLIRAVQPSDGPEVTGLLAHVSPPSSPHGRASALAGPNGSLDLETAAGLVAVQREDGHDRILGLATLTRARWRPPGHAEFAVVVADADRGRGVGALLLEHLVQVARANGIESLAAEVLADDAELLNVLAQSGFPVRESIKGGAIHVVVPIQETAGFAEASLARDRRAAAESVRVFFEPASVAVIGASRRRGTIGRTIIENLLQSGFRGPIYPVNPAAADIAGLRCYPQASAVGAKVDLAVVAVPAPAVEAVVTDCVHAGVRGIVVISSGFAEASEEGRKAQDRLRNVVRNGGLRMVGPNCMGVLNTDPSVSLNATFAPTWPPAGNVSILSQSGALGLAMLAHAASLNIGLAEFASVGNKADVSANDLLAYWATDPRTDVIALYLESFGNPRKFARIAPDVARRKPIVAVKSGRSAAGTRAASSHSAALASLDVGVDALFEQAGVLRTNTLEELFDVVALLATQPVPEGPHVGVVTNAGGPGILLADACEAHGLVLPELAPETLAALRRTLPPQAGLANPIDLIASATADDYARAIDAVGRDPGIDAVVAIYIPLLLTDPNDVAKAIATAAGALPAHKPIATVFMSSKGVPPLLSQGPRGPIPSYSFPENAAGALAAAARYGRWRRRPPGSYRRLDRDRERAIRRLIAQTPAASGWLPTAAATAILGHAGIPILAFEEVLPNPAAAAAAADRLGYPVVVKAVAPGVLHKSDVGGVILGLDSSRAVREAAGRVIARLRSVGKDASHLIVQRQLSGGVEALVGVTSDPSLGPILVAGLGGVQVELLRDVAFRLTPVSDLDAREMLSGLRTARLLDGYRGSPPADRGALLEAILTVSALVESIPEIAELELNPLSVRRPGEGAVVVDARIRIAQPPLSPARDAPLLEHI